MSLNTTEKIVEHKSGMKRETKDHKIDYTAIWYPMLDRWASHMTEGAKIYGHSNWMQANSEEELLEAEASLWRHFRDFLRNKRDEDHAAAIIFTCIKSGFSFCKRLLPKSISSFYPFSSYRQFV